MKVLLILLIIPVIAFLLRKVLKATIRLTVAVILIGLMAILFFGNGKPIISAIAPYLNNGERVEQIYGEYVEDRSEQSIFKEEKLQELKDNAIQRIKGGGEQ